MERKRMTKETGSSRRAFVLGGVGLAAFGIGWQWLGDELVRPGFTNIPGLIGWRQVQSGNVTVQGGSATSSVLVGIDDTCVEPLPEQELCAALYRGNSAKSVAVFTDFFCPNCAELEIRLAARAAETPEMTLVWHQLPLLGDNSVMVAKAAEAAALQDRYDAFLVRLQFAQFRPTSDFLANVAEEAGLNAERFLVDMVGPEVSVALETSARAAEALGIYGTPAFSMGRTLAVGNVKESVLNAALELSPDYLCL